MALDVLVGATAASLLELAGTSLSGLAGTATFKEWLSGCTFRAKAGRLQPGNHDLVRGVRTAHLAALRAVASRHRRVLAESPAPEVHADEESFGRLAEDFANQRLGIVTDADIDHDAVSVADLLHALAHPMDPSHLDASGGPALAAQRHATARALAELEADLARPAPALFRQVFGARGGAGWHDVFSLYIAEQVKTNERFRSIFFASSLVDLRQLLARLETRTAELLRLEPALTQFRSSVEERLARMEHLLQTHVGALRIEGQRLVERPRIEGAGRGGTWTYIYRFAQDPFQGRETDFAGVEQVLFDVEPAAPPIRQLFRWHLLVGAGGSGKSRFAMELLERNRFVWKSNGFVRMAVVQEQFAMQWPVSQPTLLVVDYAASRPGLAGFLRGFAERANASDLAHPVRILLVDRRRSDKVFADLMAPDVSASDQALSLCAPQAAHALEPLGEAHTVALMRGRIGQERGAQWSDTELLDVLGAFDAERRALLACIVADGLAQGTLPGVAPAESPHERRWVLFGALLRREREKMEDRLRAQGLAQQAAADTAERHFALAAFATMVRGLDAAALAQLMQAHGAGGETTRWMPQQTALERTLQLGLLKELASAEGADEDRAVPALEPDLLGERLVLQTLGAQGEADGRRAWLVDQAWTSAPYAVAAFARLCHQDYPDHTAALGYLLGRPDRHTLGAQVALLHALLIDLASLAPDDQPPDARLIQRVMRVVTVIDAALITACKEDRRAMRSLAGALRQASNIAARAVRRRIEPAQVDIDPALEALAPPPLRLRGAFDQPELSAPQAARRDAADAALPLIDAVKSRWLQAIPTSDSRTNETLFMCLAESIEASCWQRRHLAQHGGYCSNPPPDSLLKNLQGSIDFCLQILAGEGVDGLDRSEALTFAVTMLKGTVLALYDGDYREPTLARIAAAAASATPPAEPTPFALDQWMALGYFTVLQSAQLTETAAAWDQGGRALKWLHHIAFDWDRADWTTRDRWIAARMVGFELIRVTGLEQIDSLQAWQQLAAHPRFAANLEDGFQASRVEAVSMVILAWQRTHPDRTSIAWQRAFDWIGHSVWDRRARRGYAHNLRFSLWGLLTEAVADRALLESFLQRLDGAYEGNPDTGESLAQSLSAMLRDTLPSAGMFAGHGAMTCASAMVQWLSGGADADPQGGAARLLVQCAIDGQLPFALEQAGRLAQCLAGNANAALPAAQCLALVAAALDTHPQLTDSARAALPWWHTHVRAAPADLLHQLDTELALTLAHRLGRQSADDPSAELTARHLHAVLARTPHEQSYGMLRRILDDQASSQPAMQALQLSSLALGPSHEVVRDDRERRERRQQEVVAFLRPLAVATGGPSSSLMNACRAVDGQHPWPMAPLFGGVWAEAADPLQAARWLAPTHQALEEELVMQDLLAAGVQSVRRTQLRFYGDVHLLEILTATRAADAPAPACSRIVLVAPAGVMLLDGTSPRIHRFHAEIAPPRIGTPELAVAYLRFFCGLIQSASGPFRIIERSADLRTWLASAPTGAGLPNLLPTPRTTFRVGQPEDAATEGAPVPRWVVGCHVHHDTMLALAHIGLLETGHCHMVRDEAELPPGSLKPMPRMRADGWRCAS